MIRHMYLHMGSAQVWLPSLSAKMEVAAQLLTTTAGGPMHFRRTFGSAGTRTTPQPCGAAYLSGSLSRGQQPALLQPTPCSATSATALFQELAGRHGRKQRKMQLEAQALANGVASPPWAVPDARLALQDGSVWSGKAFGAGGNQVAEVVFNTSLTGYQEVMTDPSYRGQFVVFTHPHIGNTGINLGESISTSS